MTDAGPNLDGILALQRSGEALTRRLTATLDGIPEIITGWDSRRSVRVDLNRMAGVVAIVVSESWKNAVDADELAGAVLDARAAADALYTDALQRSSAEQAESADAAVSPIDDDLLERAKAYGPTRSVVDLAEGALAATEPPTAAPPVDEADEWIIDNPTSVELTIEHGILVSCRIDARWADSHSASVINAALANAISEYTETTDADTSSDPAGRDDDLVELLASILNVDFSTTDRRN